MPLSCSCDSEYEPGQVFCHSNDDFEPLRASKRKRCQSCKKLINIGDLAVKFDICRVPEYEVEINIYGEDGEMPMAPRYLCEKCGEIYLNLSAVGFNCLWVGDDMWEMLKEYQATYNPPKLSK